MPHSEPTAGHIALEFLRDLDQARETRGSRLVMAAIQWYGRY